MLTMKIFHSAYSTSEPYGWRGNIVLFAGVYQYVSMYIQHIRQYVTDFFPGYISADTCTVLLIFCMCIFCGSKACTGMISPLVTLPLGNDGHFNSKNSDFQSFQRNMAGTLLVVYRTLSGNSSNDLNLAKCWPF